jgi:hypothetical protein
MRTIVANRLAIDGKTWTDIFALNNSGTYNNQFQILDMKRIDIEGKNIYDNALWILEQVPGYTQAADKTDVLRMGYWPSYNSAYFPKIRELSGYEQHMKEKPESRDHLDYSTCVRAEIFRRDQHTVTDLESFKKIMRYNDFKTDTLSKGDPSLALACRGDLAVEPECRGAIDAKVASIRDLKSLATKKISIISGPTNDKQEAFDSSSAKCAAKPKYIFQGLPKKFSFGWVEFKTTLLY